MAQDSRLVVACAVFGFALVASAAGIGGCGSEEFGEDVVDAGQDGANPPPFVGADTGNASSSGSSGSSGNTGPNNCVAPAAVTIAPGTTSQNVTPGTPFSLPFTAKADGKDVTADVQFTVNDANVGGFAGATFNWGGKFGGALTVSAKYCGVVGTAALNLKLLAPAFTAGGGASGLPAEFAAAGVSTNAACKPTLKYPPDQVLLPPNTNVIEVHFLGATGNSKFEIAFTNAVTDVRVYTTCTAAPLVSGDPDAANGAPAPGFPTGCLFELNQAEWDYIANTNREGAPLNVTVRALGCDGTNAASSASRQISFAKQDVIGTIYYWASIRLAGNTNSGGVYRYDYGKRGQTAEAVLTPKADANGNGANSNGLCVGCHLVDREGRKMVFDFDDNDSDDEYGDMWTSVWDIPTQTSTSVIAKGSPNSFSAGYSSWNRSATRFLKSDGWGNGSAGEGNSAVPFSGPRGTFHIVSNVGAPTAKTTLGLASLRGTTPDISPDDKKVVLAAMADQEGGPTTPGFFGSSAHGNVAPDGFTDEYFTGAGLYLANWDSATNAISGATAIFPAAAANATNPGNYYYPAFSPDGSMIVFNYAASGANYHNPLAKMMLVTANGTVAAEQHKANETFPVENDGKLTNSWVRWAPFIQDYKGKRLAWVTFSSTRSYGLRIDNNTKIDCYPKENPDDVVYPLFTSEPNCTRSQLWMAAIDLDTGKVATGADVSFPAFWLPFQDRTTNNHLGQWTQKSFKGTCSPTNPCPTGYICDNGACAAVPPKNTTPPPPADCTSTIQCATNTCCVNGKCDTCADTGAPPQGCNTCLDCGGQACKNGNCGDCTSSADCCAPLVCSGGSCVKPVN